MNEDTKKYHGGHFVKKSIALLALILSIFVIVKIVGAIEGLKYVGETNGPATINVSGMGEIDAIPDTATFSFTVTEESMNVSTAQAEAASSTNAIIAYLEQNGVDKTDIQTTDYNIAPRYNYVNPTAFSSGTQVLAGYDVSESVNVSVKDISSAGTLLSGIGALGAQNVSSLSFTEANYADLVKQAEAEAITDAKTNAVRIAADLGVPLGRITAYSNQSATPPVPIFYAQSMIAGSNIAVAPVIANGQNKITANVTITYEIQ